LALLRVEFAAFHSGHRLSPPTGIVTVALVLVSRRTGVTRYPALAEPGLSSGHGTGVAPDVARDHPVASLAPGFYSGRGRLLPGSQVTLTVDVG